MPYSFTERKRIRKDFGKLTDAMEVPYLLAIQLDSYRKFLQLDRASDDRIDEGLQAAFKSATYHFNSDTETWKSDVVRERLEPVNGLIRVPEKPGLGVTLDEAELARLKQLKLPARGKWIIKTRYKNGVVMYNLADPQDSIFMVRPDRRREIPLSYDAPLTTEWWDDDGSAEYREMFARLEREGVVLESG